MSCAFSIRDSILTCPECGSHKFNIQIPTMTPEEEVGHIIESIEQVVCDDCGILVEEKNHE